MTRKSFEVSDRAQHARLAREAKVRGTFGAASKAGKPRNLAERVAELEARDGKAVSVKAIKLVWAERAMGSLRRRKRRLSWS